MNNIISIKNFSKSFGGKKAVDNLSFEVEEGEVIAFLGSNGSGKTTTIRSLLRIYKPDEGELKIFGQDYSNNIAKDIGYLPEERGIYVRSKILELLNFFGELKDVKDRKIWIEEYLKEVGLYEHRLKNINQLSSGMQQKIQLGTALIGNPKLLILDEPFKGLDPVNRYLFIEIFRKLKEKGTTIIYSTHVIDEAQRIADSVVMINKGKRLLFGKINDVRKSFGNNNIQLEFIGKFEKNDKLFKARVENNNAEITPKSGVSSDEILNHLVKSDIKIISYKQDYPSLNEIFINLVEDDK